MSGIWRGSYGRGACGFSRASLVCGALVISCGAWVSWVLLRACGVCA
ncbi:hypothetical protein OFO03_00415 [Campylobacter sp. JMF_02 ED1]|nr:MULTISPECIES: hypothetical protein [unclassified Campylobacter]MDA3048916.1 hypothetical protein [Campylobacter sp. JMF_15 NE4]MDA3050373.1 hypothetical protein [Campylobacter sp. JMF_02 ED1]